MCVVDATGKLVRGVKVGSEPECLVGYFDQLGFPVERIGLEAGKVVLMATRGSHCCRSLGGLLETRHVKAALSAMTGLTIFTVSSWSRLSGEVTGLQVVRTAGDQPLGKFLAAGLSREFERLELVHTHIHDLDRQLEEGLEDCTLGIPNVEKVHRIATLKGIGSLSAVMLVSEVFHRPRKQLPEQRF
ncbi:hypothetical protein ACQZ63_12535 [Agrobacterium sp. CG160-95]